MLGTRPGVGSNLDKYTLLAVRRAIGVIERVKEMPNVKLETLSGWDT